MNHTKELSILSIFLILGLASIGLGKAQLTTVDVLEFGAIGNGNADDSQAFLKAWDKACGTQADSVSFLIPSGKTFLLKSLSFQGPCKSAKIHVQVLGTITAPNTKQEWGSISSEGWLVYYNVNGLTVDGKGTIDGKGSIWWQNADSNNGPDALHFIGCNNLVIDHLNIINTPKRHLAIFNVNGASITNINITSPGDSPNTDGIGITSSTHVEVHYSYIQSGDDCIAIGESTSNVNISNIACGPGHGISIGSLGSDGDSADTVEGVTVRDCTFTGTQNGVRIKTFQGGSGYVKQVTFTGITLNAVDNPIIIDQYYCPSKKCSSEGNSNIRISDVSFIGVQGTTTAQDAINLSCSRSVGCTDILLNHINIKPAASSQTGVISSCINAYGSVSDAYPPVNCLLK